MWNPAFPNGKARRTLLVLFLFLAGALPVYAHGDDRAAPPFDPGPVVSGLPLYEGEAAEPVRVDWLVAEAARKTGLFRTRAARPEIVLTNGLVSRTWRLAPGVAVTAFDNLMTGASMLRGVGPVAEVTLNGKAYPVGGLLGQEEYAYLRPEWVDRFTADPEAFRLAGLSWGDTAAPFPWKRKRWCEERPWPPPGRAVHFTFVPPPGVFEGLVLHLHVEMYDAIPLVAKWFDLENGTGRPLTLDTFENEILALVEAESVVGEPPRWRLPAIHVESDYAFHGMTPSSANVTTCWEPDPRYTSQVNYRLKTPALLKNRPPIGPDLVLAPGARFSSFRTYELVYDTTERERQGLELRRFYRTVAPWTTENPILMHVRSAKPEAVRNAVDQCAEVGFEMVIMSFGSGFNPEREDPEYLAQIKALADYAHGKGIELGGYSLLASRRISDEDDVINPKTGKIGGAIFGNSPCLCSRWGEAYFRKITRFFEAAGLDVLEHDGSYPGDVCASTRHPGHRGLGDSQWMQWKKITGFYRWCRARGIYLNVPDWYFLSGSNKNGMGYREVNWSLPRARQIMLGRQNIFDGTWYKTPSMGWMFVPLVQYHGGGAAATLEPLSEHLDAYAAHLAQNFGAGVQACWRGPRLFDTEATRDLVKRWVAFYKKHRAILDSDVIHLRRPDGRDLDGLLHVNPRLRERGLLVLFNPLDRAIRKTIRVPLYYTGLTEEAAVREGEGPARTFRLDRKYMIALTVEVPPRSMQWFVVEAHAGGKPAEGRKP